MLLSKEIREQINKFAYTFLSGVFFYKTVSKTFGLQQTTMRAIIHKHWWTAASKKSCPTGISKKHTEHSQKEPYRHFKAQQSSIPSVKVRVYDSAKRKRLGKNVIYESVSKYTEALLTFSKKHLDDPKDLWEDILWTDETEVEVFGRRTSCYIWHKTNTFQKMKWHT